MTLTVHLTHIVHTTSVLHFSFMEIKIPCKAIDIEAMDVLLFAISRGQLAQ